MKHMKILGLLAVAVAALTAFAGTASATEVTSPKGTKLGVGTKLIGQNVGNVVLDGTINITCKKASGEGEITNAGGASTTVEGVLIFTSYGECGSNTVTLVSTGTGQLHSLGNGYGTGTSTGAKVTVLTHNILGTVHCVYTSNETDAGTIEDSSVTGGTATLTIESLSIPRETTDFGCGSTSELTAEGTLTSPDSLYID